MTLRKTGRCGFLLPICCRARAGLWPVYLGANRNGGTGYKQFYPRSAGHDLNGRFDLPFYFNGFEIIRNFLSNYKGNVKYRPGFEFISKIRDNQEAVLMEFRFNTEQAYLLEFTEGKLRFYTYDGNGNFGYVVDTIPANKVPALSSNSQDGFVVSDSRGNSNCYTVFNGDNKAPIGDWKTYWLQLKYPDNKILKEYKN